MLKEIVLEEMKKVYHDHPKGIQHTLDVLEYAERIMEGEIINKEIRELISITAILHDIGIPEAIRIHGSSEGKYQEHEGAIIARQILEKTNYDPIKINRVCFIVGNHHTKSKIDGLDFQIIWEADLLVNLENNNLRQVELRECIEVNFKTKIGLTIALEKYII